MKPTAVQNSKSVLRRMLGEKLRAITAEERQRLSRDLCDRLRRQSQWQEAASVLFYSPMNEEPDVSLLLDEAFAAGKKVHLPRYDASAACYTACSISSRADLAPGYFGIQEPGAHCAVAPLKHLDFLLVPGIGFDLTGHRLGRGKGFFDRLLAEVRGHKCGVCFDAQVVLAVPDEPHDIRLDSILTPTRWHLCQGAA